MTENPSTTPFEIWRCPAQHDDTPDGTYVFTSPVVLEREQIVAHILDHLDHCAGLRTWIRRLERTAQLAVEAIGGDTVDLPSGVVELQELVSGYAFWHDLRHPQDEPMATTAKAPSGDDVEEIMEVADVPRVPLWKRVADGRLRSPEFETEAEQTAYENGLNGGLLLAIRYLQEMQ